MTDKTHIVIATDANYLPHSAALVESIAANHQGEVQLHVLASNLSEANRQMLSSRSPKVSCTFYDVDSEAIEKRLFGGKHIAGDRSLAAFSRLLIPELLPPEVDRCLYLDVDGIVTADLGELMQTDLEGYAIAGVLDTNPLRRHFTVGLGPEDIYINSGMILWNLDYCRRDKTVDRFARFITERDGNVDAMDQGTLNGVLHAETKILPPAFNAMTSFFFLNADEIKQIFNVPTYTDAEIKEAAERPVFIHFTPFTTTRPWVEKCRHPRKEEYARHRRKFDPEFQLQKDTRPAKLRVLSTLFFHCRPLYKLLMRLNERRRTPSRK